MPIVEIYCTGN